MFQRNSLNEALYKNKSKYSRSRFFLISPQRISIISESRIFVKRLVKLSVLLNYTSVPLGPSLATAFLSKHEKKNWLKSYQQGFKPVFYRRFVDDIFALLESNDPLKYLQQFLISCHINMSFSMEAERQNKIYFLDVEVIREQGKFTTTIYRKPYFSGVIVTLKVFYFCL